MVFPVEAAEGQRMLGRGLSGDVEFRCKRIMCLRGLRLISGMDKRHMADCTDHMPTERAQKIGFLKEYV